MKERKRKEEKAPAAHVTAATSEKEATASEKEAVVPVIPVISLSQAMPDQSDATNGSSKFWWGSRRDSFQALHRFDSTNSSGRNVHL